MEVVLLAPGPSMSRELAGRFRGSRVGVVSNCHELAPWADFLVAQDKQWWRKYPEAMRFSGRKFTGNKILGLERVPGSRTNWNSGVLALQAAVRCMGATSIRLYGFDMHGTHFFGPYTNGLGNTQPHRREVHLAQYRAWADNNQQVRVLNCTPGSALDCFEVSSE